jgi:hypothetical protein
VRRKLVQELAGLAAPPERAGGAIVKVAAKPGYDCLVGEEMWRGSPWNHDTR